LCPLVSEANGRETRLLISDFMVHRPRITALKLKS
jgi:hypothetical protein